jgi:hypothetical protein
VTLRERDEKIGRLLREGFAEEGRAASQQHPDGERTAQCPPTPLFLSRRRGPNWEQRYLDHFHTGCRYCEKQRQIAAQLEEQVAAGRLDPNEAPAEAPPGPAAPGRGPLGPRAGRVRWARRLAGVAAAAVVVALVGYHWDHLPLVPRGGKGDPRAEPGWLGSTSLWTSTGQPPADQEGPITVSRSDPNAHRFLVLTSTWKARAWAVRANHRGALVLEEVRGLAVTPARPGLVPLARPERGIDHEWFVVLFATSPDRRSGKPGLPDPEEGQKLSDFLQRTVNEDGRLRNLVRVLTPEKEAEFADALKEAYQQSNPIPGLKVQFGICHWKVSD